MSFLLRLQTSHSRCRPCSARRDVVEETAALRHFYPAYSGFPSHARSRQVRTKWTALKGWLHLRR